MPGFLNQGVSNGVPRASFPGGCLWCHLDGYAAWVCAHPQVQAFMGVYRQVCFGPKVCVSLSVYMCVQVLVCPCASVSEVWMSVAECASYYR